MANSESIYSVNGHGFDSFMEAVAFAKPIRAEVIENASGIRRWSPANCPERRQALHVLVEANGAKRAFSKVRR